MDKLFPGCQYKSLQPLDDVEKWWLAAADVDESPLPLPLPLQLSMSLQRDESIFNKCQCGGADDDILIDSTVTCKKCGTILGRIFDTTAEYRYFANDDRGGDPCRVGAPQDPDLPEASLGTMILGGKGKAMGRIRKFHTWNAMPYKERALLQTMDRLSIIATNNGINSSIVDDTRDMFVTIHKLCDRRGLTRDAILASCLYSSLKKSGSPRKPKDIADMFSLTTATFTKALKYFQEIFVLAEQKGILQKKTVDTSQGSTRAIEYVSLPLSKMPLPRNKHGQIECAIKTIAEKAEKEGYSVENVPPSLAAGCIAFVLQYYPDIGVTLQDIENCAGVSVATLQKCLRRLNTYSDILCDIAGLVREKK
jgi:transcription initiation factor TFIIIB Brf1 subunit/transcription initiation factor TFIIB